MKPSTWAQIFTFAFLAIGGWATYTGSAPLVAVAVIGALFFIAIDLVCSAIEALTEQVAESARRDD